MSSQKWLTSHSKYKNTSAGVGDSVGPSNDHQLSVDDLINLFTYFNEYMSIL